MAFFKNLAELRRVSGGDKFSRTTLSEASKSKKKCNFGGISTNLEIGKLRRQI